MRRLSIEFWISNFSNDKPTKEAENWFKIHWPWFGFWFMLLVQFRNPNPRHDVSNIECTVRPHTNQIKHMSKLLLLFTLCSFGLFFVLIFSPVVFFRSNFPLSFVIIIIRFNSSCGAWIVKWRSAIKWSEVNDFTFWKSQHSIEYELNGEGTFFAPLDFSFVVNICLMLMIWLNCWHWFRKEVRSTTSQFNWIPKRMNIK